MIPYFWLLVTFGDEVKKILCNLCLHFARQNRQDGRKQNENHTTKMTKITKTWDEGNNRSIYIVVSELFENE